MNLAQLPPQIKVFVPVGPPYNGHPSFVDFGCPFRTTPTVAILPLIVHVRPPGSHENEDTTLLEGIPLSGFRKYVFISLVSLVELARLLVLWLSFCSILTRSCNASLLCFGQYYILYGVLFCYIVFYFVILCLESVYVAKPCETMVIETTS